MINPASMMKMMSAKNKFNENHPKFSAFLSAAFNGGVKEDTIIEISVTKPDGQKMTTNLKVLASDVELLEQLKELIGK